VSGAGGRSRGGEGDGRGSVNGWWRGGPKCKYRTSCGVMNNPSTNSAVDTKPNACRDRELVRYVGRHGIVTVPHIMAAMKVGRAITCRRVARCIEAGLLERGAVLNSEPTLIRATREGIAFAGLGLPMASFSPGGVDHYLRCASTAQKLVEEFGLNVLTEEEVAVMEAIEETRFASAEFIIAGRLRFHRPDLLVFTKDERWIAVEVELTPKAPFRLRSIVKAWRRVTSVDEVRYYCRPGKTHRAVSRAVEAVKASEKIKVFEGVPG
jgi:hypothetical protein